MHKLVAVLVAVSVAGCGLTMTRGPDPSWPPDRRPECTESMEAPKRDAYGAIAGFLAILVGLLFVEVDDENPAGVPLLVGGGIVMAGSYASGGIGYFRVKRCRRAIAEFERRTPAAPPVYPPPTQAPAR